MENLKRNNKTNTNSNVFNKPDQKGRARSNSIHYIEEAKDKIKKEKLPPAIANKNPENKKQYKNEADNIYEKTRDYYLNPPEKLSAFFTDENGNIICIYRHDEGGMVGGVLEPDGSVKVIKSDNIYNGLTGENGQKLADKLAQTPGYPWDLVFENGKLHVWPHMEAAAKMDQGDIFRFMVIRNGFIFNKAVEDLRAKGFTEKEIKQLKEVKNLRGKTFSEHDLKNLEKKNGFTEQEIKLITNKKFTKKNMQEFEKVFSQEKFNAIKEVENKTRLDILKGSGITEANLKKLRKLGFSQEKLNAVQDLNKKMELKGFQFHHIIHESIFTTDPNTLTKSEDQVFRKNLEVAQKLLRMAGIDEKKLDSVGFNGIVLPDGKEGTVGHPTRAIHNGPHTKEYYNLICSRLADIHYKTIGKNLSEKELQKIIQKEVIAPTRKELKTGIIKLNDADDNSRNAMYGTKHVTSP